jgi:hypothetical protein
MTPQGPKTTWEQVRALASMIDRAAQRGEATAEHAARLSRLVLDFDESITGIRSTKPGESSAQTG